MLDVQIYYRTKEPRDDANSRLSVGKKSFPPPRSFLIIEEFNTVLSSLNITNFLITIIGPSKGDKARQQQKNYKQLGGGKVRG